MHPINMFLLLVSGLSSRKTRQRGVSRYDSHRASTDQTYVSQEALVRGLADLIPISILAPSILTGPR